MPSERQREYWRLAQRKHRLKQALLKQAAVYTPRITRFELCSLCGKWHPVEAILPIGHFARFSLDSFHSHSQIDSWLRKRQQHQDQVFDPLDLCARMRMQFYNESREVAEANCKILFEDPLLRHNPPGLIQPAGKLEQIDLAAFLDAKQRKELSEMQKCFQKKVEKGMDSQEAVEECMVELKPGKEQFTVGDLYGKTREEIDAMAQEEPDPNLTVGGLYGKTKEQILKEQREKANN